MQVVLTTIEHLERNKSRDDQGTVFQAAFHLGADYRNAVIVAGHTIHAVGWVNDSFDDHLVIDGQVTEFRSVAKWAKKNKIS